MLRPTVTKVIPQENNILFLEFDNGEKKLFDVKPYIKGSLFGKLNNESYFKTENQTDIISNGLMDKIYVLTIYILMHFK